MKCIVASCKNKKRGRHPGISFHRFPTDKVMRQKWLESLGCKDLVPGFNDLVCSEHFLTKDLLQLEKKTILYSEAIPYLTIDTVADDSEEEVDNAEDTFEMGSESESHSNDSGEFFQIAHVQVPSYKPDESHTMYAEDIPEENFSYKNNKQPIIMKIESLQNKNVPLQSQVVAPNCSTNSDFPNNIHQVTNLLNITKSNHQLEKKNLEEIIIKLQAKLAKKTRDIKVSKQLVRRRDHRIALLKDILRKLKGKNFVAEELGMVLDQIEEPAQLLRSKWRNFNENFCVEIRAFAVALNFLAPKAYEYLRKRFNRSLPRSKTLSKWQETAGCAVNSTAETLAATGSAADESMEEATELIPPKVSICGQR